MHAPRSGPLPTPSTARAPLAPPRAPALPAALAPVDRLALAFMLALAPIGAASLDRPLPWLGALLALGLAVAAAAHAAAGSRVARFVHGAMPFVVVGALFDLVGPAVAAANPARWDAALAALDARHFGALAPAWRGALGRPAWLTDAVSLVYVSYYFVPVAMASALRLGGRRREADAVVFGVVACFLASYAAYFVAPATGPRVPADVADAVLGGGAVSAGVRAFLGAAEHNRLDAFPSAHTAVPLVELGLAWRYLPRWRAPLALLAAATVFSTVYLSLHYVVDVVAGAALSGVVLAALGGTRRA